MIGFLLKKNFFDLWDNLFKVVLINLGFIASLAFPVFIPPQLAAAPILAFATLLIGILWCFVYLSAAASSLKVLSDYGNFGIADFFRNFKTSWPFGLFFGFIVFFGFIACTEIIPFYLNMKSPVGLLFAAIIFWTLVAAVLALQFFFAIRSRLDNKLGKVIKKCFIVFFDNPLFCIFSLIHNLVVLTLSAFVAFLFPGPAGVLLFLDQGLRLRLLKYDWLEANPDAKRREIPWDTILIDEREKTGTRSLKSFIFPWKD
jgi:hypothetical protein